MPLANPVGLELLGRVQLTAQAAGTAIVTIPARDMLVIQACVTGYQSGGGIFGLRFGTAEGAVLAATTNYWHRNHPTAITAVATWGTAVQVPSATMILLANANISLGRTSLFSIMNQNRTAHPCQWETVNETGSAATIGVKNVGQGEFISPAAGQIRSVQMVVSGGNLNAGSGFSVFGTNLS